MEIFINSSPIPLGWRIKSELFWEILISIKRSLLAPSHSQNCVAPVAADVLLKQQKQRSHQLGETPTDAPLFHLIHASLCVAALASSFVQLTAAAPFLLTSNQPCFKTVCVCSATTGGGGWLHSLVAARLKIKLCHRCCLRQLTRLAFHNLAT